MIEEFVGSKKKYRSVRTTRMVTNIIVYAILIVMSIIWLFPIIWIILTSFRGEAGTYIDYFFPKEISFRNYELLLTPNYITGLDFPRWFGNTIIVALFSCLITSLFVLAIAYVMSRFRFKMRKRFMNIALILGMFPGFMSMIAIYFIFEAVGLTQTLAALVIAYSFGAGTGFYISKGFFDTVPKSLDEAARIDGANRAQVFFRIILPLSKPIIIYTVLGAFMAPWMDFIFVSVIMSDKAENYTVARGLVRMLDREMLLQGTFTQFAAGAVLVSVPITALFIMLQRYYVEGITGGAVKG